MNSARLIFYCLALSSVALVANGKYLMVCYLGSWATYRPGAGAFNVEDIDPNICTHLTYGFAGLSPQNTIISLDPYNDLYDNYGKGAYIRFTNLKKKNPELKTLLAIGGWNEGSVKYSQMAASAPTRTIFIDSVVTFLHTYNFDGLDLDWEYPANRGGQPEDKENMAQLLREMRAAFDQSGLLLTAAVSGGKPTMDTAYDIPAMVKSLDYISVMAYDYHGAWEQFTGINTPIYARPNDTALDRIFNVNFSVNYWIQQGAPPSKLVLGMASYGRGWTLNDPSEHGLDATAYIGIDPGPYTGASGTWGFNEICTKLTQEEGWTVVRDPYYLAPYAYRERQWISYDDTVSLTVKVSLAKMLNLAGGMIWSLDTDDFHGSCYGQKFYLVNAIDKAFNGYVPPPPTEPTELPTLSPEPTSSPLTSQEPTGGTTETPGVVCHGPGYIRDPENCQIFYQCVPEGGDKWNAVKHVCSGDLVFDTTTNTCNFRSNVPDCDGKITADKYRLIKIINY